jgi:hypothetical protein
VPDAENKDSGILVKFAGLPKSKSLFKSKVKRSSVEAINLIYDMMLNRDKHFEQRDDV